MNRADLVARMGAQLDRENARLVAAREQAARTEAEKRRQIQADNDELRAKVARATGRGG